MVSVAKLTTKVPLKEGKPRAPATAKSFYSTFSVQEEARATTGIKQPGIVAQGIAQRWFEDSQEIYPLDLEPFIRLRRDSDGVNIRTIVRR